MFGHAGTTQICAEETTNTCPSSPTLSHSAGLEQLWRVAITDGDLSAQSSTRNILLPLSGEGCTYCIPSLRGSPALLNSWIYGCGALRASRAAVLGKMDRASLASECFPLLLAALTQPQHLSYMQRWATEKTRAEKKRKRYKIK